MHPIKELIAIRQRQDTAALMQIVQNISATDEKGNTPLFHAIYQNRIDIVWLLLLNGAEINVTNQDGDTPLIIASWIGRLEIVGLLLRFCANINATWENGLTALMYAIQHNHTDIAHLLVDFGAIMLSNGAEVDSQNVTFSVPDDTPLQVVGASSQNPGPQEF